MAGGARRIGLLIASVIALALAPATAWAGGWTLETPAAPAHAISTELDGVSCSAPGGCAAVGHWVGADHNALTLSELWDGTSWSVKSTPGAPGSFLEAVSCPAAGVCTAVGGYEPTTNSQLAYTVAERLNDGHWAQQSIPNRTQAAVNLLWSVSCATVPVCTAVGYTTEGRQTRTLAERWQDGRWRIQATADPPGSTLSALYGVSCPTAGMCMAAGYYSDPVSGNALNLAERWSDGRWQIVPTPNPAAITGAGLRGVACSRPRACMAVGDTTPTSGPNQPLAERWDGSAWQLEPVPLPAGASGGFLQGASCWDAGGCEAVGGWQGILGGNPSLAELWNGSAWTVQATPNPPGALASFLSGGVSCPAAGRCTAVGTYQTATDQSAFAEGLTR